MKIRHVFHFPNGKTHNLTDVGYCFSQINVGEKIIIENDPTEYIVSDIKNQFKVDDYDFPSHTLKMIMRNVILTRA